jgi:hypothetical protein
MSEIFVGGLWVEEFKKRLMEAKEQNKKEAGVVSYVKMLIEIFDSNGECAKIVRRTELETLMHNAHIHTAKMFLGYAREISGDNEAKVSNIKESAKDAGVSLEECGTSENELRILLVHGYLKEAQDKLHQSAKDEPGRRSWPGLSAEYLQKACALIGEIRLADEEFHKKGNFAGSVSLFKINK